jgi:hypothetical protein
VNQVTWTYLAQLARAMQMEGVDGKVAGELVAEIDAHLAESGADPADEFGPPAALARELVTRAGARRLRWVPSVWSTLVTALAAFVVVVGIGEGIRNGWAATGVEIPASAAAYGLTIVCAGMGFGYTATRRLDGRSWSPLTGWRAWVAIGIIAVVATTLATVVDDRVLVTMPRAGLVALLAVMVPALIAVVVLSYNPIRFPAHAQHLRPLRRGLLAGTPTKAPGD